MQCIRRLMLHSSRIVVDNPTAQLDLRRQKAHGVQGDLALLATDGGGGVPTGHTTAWKADHKLHLKFLRALAAASQPSGKA